LILMISNKVLVTRQPNDSHVFSGESITLTCEVQGGETTEWSCEWRRSGSIIQRTDSKDWTFIVSESSSGNYMCQCRSRDDWHSSTQWSETIKLSVSISNKVLVTRQPNDSHVFSGESITLTCEVQGGETTEWSCEWRRSGSIIQRTDSKDWTFIVSESSSGNYMCQCRSRDDWYSSTQIGHIFIQYVPLAHCMISCNSSVEDEQDADNNKWSKASGTGPTAWQEKKENKDKENIIRHFLFRLEDNTVTLLLSLSAVVRIFPNRSQFFPYESVTLSCVDSENSPDWTVKRNTAGNETADWGKRNGSQHVIDAVYLFDSGRYWCELRTGACSEVINVTVTDGPVILQSPVLPVAEGDAVILRCIHSDASSSSNFTKFYKNGLLIGSSSTGSIAVRDVSESDEGLYKCSITGAGESPESWLSVRVKCFR
uniref:Ig-like domain-containing protein n=1 Tax=Xiphophorus couchianus TaxID=32473 RepID=A0A3B5MAY8_9TELE